MPRKKKEVITDGNGAIDGVIMEMVFQEKVVGRQKARDMQDSYKILAKFTEGVSPEVVLGWPPVAGAKIRVNQGTGFYDVFFCADEKEGWKWGAQ